MNHRFSGNECDGSNARCEKEHLMCSVVVPILMYQIKIRSRDKQMMNRRYDKLPIRSYDKRGVYRCG
jgi:hypothetical protein